MRSPVEAEAAVEYGLFTCWQAREAGYTNRGIALRVRRGEWLRCGKGILRSLGHAEQAGDRLLIAVLRAGPLAVASHFSAAGALGWDLVDEPAEAEILVPRTHGSARVPGARLRRQTLNEADVTAVGVLPVTVPVLTAIDISAGASLADAVVAVDSALRAKQVTPAGLRRELRGRRTMTSHPAAKSVLDLADATSGSVPESLARVLFHRMGIPMPH